MNKIQLETPENIEQLKKDAGNKASYKCRFEAVEVLGGFQCQQSTDILFRLMINDKVYAVQELAFRKLQAFGEDVKLPKKKKGHLVKDINKVLGKVRNSLPDNFSSAEFNDKFQTMYPIEHDIYSFEKRNNFDKWVSDVLKSLPKK
ncbi:putative uncharacterized protein [Aliivibrio wodanis]|uniref:HEAT repeat domain-containing protein n=1 Tax=Aliivibrio wodanis TaxID=80852 RepID=A0A090I6P1_9GAMM|nr:putative uncharacterized protein [Aliivibrio wodanis]